MCMYVACMYICNVYVRMDICKVCMYVSYICTYACNQICMNMYVGEQTCKSLFVCNVFLNSTISGVLLFLSQISCIYVCMHTCICMCVICVYMYKHITYRFVHM